MIMCFSIQFLNIVDLRKNKTGDQGIQHFENDLTELYLGENQIGNQAVQHLALASAKNRVKCTF